jgi:ribonuclease R
MEDHVGSEFEGCIIGVTLFGVFVELKEMYAEGLVHITSLTRHDYRFDPVGRCLVGERAGRIYRFGDTLRVRVARVDLDERKIDFDPVSEPVGPAGPARKKKAGGKKTAGRKKVAQGEARGRTSRKKSPGNRRRRRG